MKEKALPQLNAEEFTRVWAAALSIHPLEPDQIDPEMMHRFGEILFKQADLYILMRGMMDSQNGWAVSVNGFPGGRLRRVVVDGVEKIILHHPPGILATVTGKPILV